MSSSIKWVNILSRLSCLALTHAHILHILTLLHTLTYSTSTCTQTTHKVDVRLSRVIVMKQLGKLKWAINLKNCCYYVSQTVYPVGLTSWRGFLIHQRHYYLCYQLDFFSKTSISSCQLEFLLWYLIWMCIIEKLFAIIWNWYKIANRWGKTPVENVCCVCVCVVSCWGSIMPTIILLVPGKK